MEAHQDLEDRDEAWQGSVGRLVGGTHGRSWVGSGHSWLVRDETVRPQGKIRELEANGELTGHVPIIAVTANARAEQVQTALDAGMVGSIFSRLPRGSLYFCLCVQFVRLLTLGFCGVG